MPTERRPRSHPDRSSGCRRNGERGPNTGTAKNRPFDRERKAEYLEYIAEHGRRTEAAWKVGVCTATVANHCREGGPLYDPEFAAGVRDAERLYADKLLAEMDRRGRLGVDEPIYYKGARIDTVKKYSDRLLLALARMHVPELREKLEINATHAADPADALARLNKDERDVLRDILHKHADAALPKDDDA